MVSPGLQLWQNLASLLQNKPLISKVAMVAVPGLSSSLFQAKLELLSSFTALPAPVKLLAKSAMLRSCERVLQSARYLLWFSDTP